MLFNIIVILITVIYIIVLELSKNTLPGWGIAICLCALAIGLNVFLRKKDRQKSLYRIAVFFGFIALIVLNYFVTAPPFKRVPAVSDKKAKVTEEVAIQQGKVTGVYNEDGSVRIFAGIPYAAPPVKDLRFREPQPQASWDGVLSCDSFAPMAMQPRGSVIFDSLSHILGWHDYEIKFGDEYIEPMSEDCLYLNVFAPDKKEGELLPVIFYIHGGSLTTGQPSYTEYRGESLAKKGVVFVNCGYRLGVFGYYAAEDLKAESPNGTTGNYGLLDQIAALKWVYNNIEAFGGDPQRITIAGESAGSSSVNAICVSPLTEGLFDYAIAESSGIVPKKPFHTFRSYEEALEQSALTRAEFSAASSEDLRKIPADELIKTAADNSAMTIDGYAITEMPYLTYEKGENHEKALLNGFNSKEADAFMLNVKATKENYTELLAEDLGEFAKEMAVAVPYDSPQRDQYFIVDAKGEAKGALNTAYSAMWFSYSHYVWSSYMAAQGRPCYEYYFTKTNKRLSGNHAGELPYAYGNLSYHDKSYDESDYALSEIMQSYWVNFAKSGDPNGDGLPVWPGVTGDSSLLLNLDSDIAPMEDPNLEAYKVIDRYMNKSN